MSKKLQGNGLFESSRMMLPEHKEWFLQHQKQLNKQIKPQFDEQRLDELSRIMSEAILDHLEVTITIWGLYEHFTITGKIEKVEATSKKIKVVYGDEYTWINFDDIVHIE